MTTRITKEEIKKEIRKIKNAFGIKNSVDDDMINALSNREGIQEISSAHQSNQLAWLFIDKIIYDALADRMTLISEMIDLFPEIIDFSNGDSAIEYANDKYKVIDGDEEYELLDYAESIDEAEGMEVLDYKQNHYQISLFDADDVQQLNAFVDTFYVLEDDFSTVCAFVRR